VSGPPSSGPASQGVPGQQQQQLSGPPSFTLRRPAAGGVGSRCVGGMITKLVCSAYTSK
jgi:hypothetical protein